MAEQQFANVNVRAVKDDNGVCVAALQGNQQVNLTFGCSEPASCIVELHYDLDVNDGFIDQAFDEDNSAPLDLVFDNAGIAALDRLVYRDAGRISLAIDGVIDGATITSGNALVNVAPQRLVLSEDTDTTGYDAGDNFDLSVLALGAQNGILQNYQPGSLQFKANRVGRTASGYVDGQLVSATLGTTIPGQINANFTSTNNPAFNGGSLEFSAHYSEVDSIEFDVRDNDYLQAGIVVASSGTVTLGPFVPAYFDVEVVNQNTINFVNTYTSATPFSYLGRDIGLSEPISLELTAKNAKGNITRNYQSNNNLDDWAWLPVSNPPSGISFSQTNQTISVFNAGTATTENVTDNIGVVLGKKRLNIDGMRVVYQKRFVEFSGVNDKLTDADKPFAASATINFDESIFSGTPISVCHTKNYANNKTACEDFSFGPITGADLRWGRLALENTFGPETEDKKVPFRTEYWDGEKFVVNRDDNVHTKFVKDTQRITKKDIDDGLGDITGQVTAKNTKLEITRGKSMKFEGIEVTKPLNGQRGVLLVELEPDPANTPDTITWDDYLQYDWNGTDEAGIGNPSAEVSFGQYRGNDRIIHWREVFY